MIRFCCDYEEGAYSAILSALEKSNYEQTPGYSEDVYCDRARELIRARCECPAAAVHFLVGGTQTNQTVIAAALRPYQGVLSAVTGHINAHETGAIEATGHKVLALPSDASGKLCAEAIRAAVEAHFSDVTHEHIVQPAMVYLSHPTENGALYTLSELSDIAAVCREKGLFLYLDGARLGYGLAAEPEVSLPALARLTDAFYIGGTKVGALFGEALVIRNPALQQDFRYMIKRQGGMLAKGRLLGIQFLTLMQDGLYERLGAHAVSEALRIRAAFTRRGVPLLTPSKTNQQFPILTHAQQAYLSENFAFSYWQKIDGAHDAVRFCTSWATRPENTDQLLAAILAMP